jgi:hypothetical protein
VKDGGRGASFQHGPGPITGGSGSLAQRPTAWPRTGST